MTAVPANLGFVMIQQDASGYVGGMLATNLWGRPLEFRISSAVQPSKVHQILYGKSLEPFICGDLIARTLLEKSATPVQFVILDHPSALDLRTVLNIPVGLLLTDQRPLDPSVATLPISDQLHVHAQFPGDVSAFREVLDRMGNFDLFEPFSRIREAMTEARKIGVGQRAAA